MKAREDKAIGKFVICAKNPIKAGPTNNPAYPKAVTIVKAVLDDIPESFPELPNKIGTIFDAPIPIKQKPNNSKYVQGL